ncbi:hypothetical protein [Aurantimonas marina]|uniref:hypothetical protein n=1 Tax=Aurantimonas marina TaxID=2780508 RepID=UPI0019CF6F2E|nr:hypothetical protein [Aurantimonas marina]
MRFANETGAFIPLKIHFIPGEAVIAVGFRRRCSLPASRTIDKNAYEFVLARERSRFPDKNSPQKQTPVELNADLPYKEN